MTPTATYWSNVVFLALTVWREARGQSDICKLAVAYSILERVAHPKWWGHDVMSVVFKRWQYSSLTAPNDPQLTTWPTAADPMWDQSVQVAQSAVAGSLVNPAKGADSYFDISIKAPDWAKPEMFVVELGRLKFYDLDRDFEAEAT